MIYSDKINHNNNVM